MTKNMGGMDKGLRIAAAIAIGALYYLKMLPGIWAVILLIVAAVFILTSFVGFCPLYAALGIRTNRQPKA